MVDISNVTTYVALAAIQGAIVALPQPAALERLGRLRSPAWALLAPGSLIVGTFGVLAVPLLASGLAVLADIATPVLAAIAVIAVVHGRHRSLLLVPLALGVLATAGSG
jgi:xanthine/uracil/vitamin C permease (AzgA family)